MRILFITAYYPPCDYGWGYMRVCEQVADGLHHRGHDIAILTSTCRHGDEFKPYPAYRSLHIDPDWTLRQPAMWQFFVGRKSREQQDVAHLHRRVDEFAPDVIFVWHAHGLSRAMLQAAEALSGISTVYYFANYLPELPDEYIHYWQGKPQFFPARLLKGILAKIALRILSREGKPIRLKYPHSISVSSYVRQRLLTQALVSADAVVIPNGVDLTVFNTAVSATNANGKTLKCVVAGRVAEEKGIHTLLHAFGLLHQQKQLEHIHLNIFGDGPEEYKAKLSQIVTKCELQDFVSFQAPVSIQEMPEIYSQHDVLFLPSEWHEPLSCTMLEAMASGLLVIGTTTGGSGEALFHEKTGLVFNAGDPQSLAEEIMTALENPVQVQDLAQAGQREVIENFNIQGSVERIEAHLLTLTQEVGTKQDAPC
ncbi:MAG: glycosyltransferase family 4 protein [Chloroflexi bacterium]|nr:glycosyltransferase family 4 protein [Chloroflexota bacterium]